MPTNKSKDLEVRRIAFAALMGQRLPRLTVQERLGISEREYYRLRAALLASKREPARAH